MTTKPDVQALLPGALTAAHSARPVTSLERTPLSPASFDLTALTETARCGSEDAFSKLYLQVAPAVFDYLVGLTRDRAIAEDLLQETFLAAWRGLPSLRDPSRGRAWLYGIARNVAVEHLRSRVMQLPVDEVLELEASDPSPEEAVISNEASRLVWTAAATLEPQHQEALNLSLRHGLTNGELGELLGLPPERTKHLLVRSREALGRAIRVLFVARSAAACPNLHALAPLGADSLTIEQRRAVDYHMRHCDECRDLGLRLTKPEELFGTVVLATLPSTAQHAPVVPVPV